MPKNFTQKQIIIIAGAALVVILGGIVFLLNVRSKSASQAALKISIWGTDSPQAFNDLINAYSGPGSGTSAEIKYTQIDPSDYQSKVLAALAAGTGPDIFEIGNRDLPQWQNVLAPIPTTLSTQFNQVTLENDFPDVVNTDFVSDGYIYGLPLSIDTMAMIYNKDIFNTAGIATVPKTWEELDADVPLLRVENAQGQITQAAAAIGGSETSIPNASDMVFLLMLQNGTQMNSSDESSVTFATSGNGADNSGLNAFNFYLQFANSGNSNYTWNDALGNDVDSFAQGKTAVIFDYSSALAAIKAKSPFLNYGIATMPQPANATIAVNYAKYNGLAVSKNSADIAGAWSFIINLTTSVADENMYTKDTGAPPALRVAIAADQTDPTLAVFAEQALTAKSWYESNSAQIDSIMNGAIQNVLNGSSDSTTALTQAQTAINSIGG